MLETTFIYVCIFALYKIFFHFNLTPNKLYGLVKTLDTGPKNAVFHVVCYMHFAFVHTLQGINEA
jgi:hypothetical protein